ncbi:hypothetical protein KI387_025835, partial [Taxus chinensis]
VESVVAGVSAGDVSPDLGRAPYRNFVTGFVLGKGTFFDLSHTPSEILMITRDISLTNFVAKISYLDATKVDLVPELDYRKKNSLPMADPLLKHSFWDAGATK